MKLTSQLIAMKGNPTLYLITAPHKGCALPESQAQYGLNGYIKIGAASSGNDTTCTNCQCCIGAPICSQCISHLTESGLCIGQVGYLVTGLQTQSCHVQRPSSPFEYTVAASICPSASCTAPVALFSKRPALKKRSYTLRGYAGRSQTSFVQDVPGIGRRPQDGEGLGWRVRIAVHWE